MEPFAFIGMHLDLIVWIVFICINGAVFFHLFGLWKNIDRMDIAKSLGRKQLRKAAFAAMWTHLVLIIAWVLGIGIMGTLKVKFDYDTFVPSLLLVGYVAFSVVYGFRKTYSKSVKRQWSGLKGDVEA